jgi:hypothetical protein
MIRFSRQRWMLTMAAIVLASFAAGVAAELHHTDDGCQVETHCVACMNATVLRTGLRAQGPAPSPIFVTVGRIAEPAVLAIAEVDPPAAPSRAPPLA